MDKKVIKVVWICSVSNPMLRNYLDLGLPWWHKVIRHALGHPPVSDLVDTAIWNSNALDEFNKLDDVDLHVIFVHPNMCKKEQRFRDGIINYYAISNGDTSLFRYIKVHLLNNKNVSFYSTWRRIAALVDELNPDVIHLMGAENPSYSLSALYLPTNIPLIVQLQTLLLNPATAMANEVQPNQRLCEHKVLLRANYIGSKSALFPHLTREYLKPDAIYINTQLIIAEKPDQTQYETNFDFVYFANYIHKSIDLVIEAFGIAYRKNSNITLDIIGGAYESELSALKARLEELGCKEAVRFEGKLPTHNDVIEQIKKARYALLPLKADLVSSTVREAMYAGLPVITTITQGTPKLNLKRETVLLSEIGDHEALAANMLKVVGDKALADRLRSNAFITVDELYGDNPGRARMWTEAYHACIDNFRNGTPIPDFILNKN